MSVSKFELDEKGFVKVDAYESQWSKMTFAKKKIFLSELFEFYKERFSLRKELYLSVWPCHKPISEVFASTHTGLLDTKIQPEVVKYGDFDLVNHILLHEITHHIYTPVYSYTGDHNDLLWDIVTHDDVFKQKLVDIGGHNEEIYDIYCEKIGRKWRFYFSDILEADAAEEAAEEAKEAEAYAVWIAEQKAAKKALKLTNKK